MRNTLVRVLTGKTDSGRWAATSTESPYFLFEGDSEEEVIAISRRALAFHTRGVNVPRDAVERERGKHLSTFYPTRVVEVEEDFAAA